jgi:hypothetical protein
MNGMYFMLVSDRKHLIPKYCQLCGKLLTGKQQKFCSRECSFYDYSTRTKTEVIEHYGGKCQHCGTDDIDVLTLDHIDNNGAEHRQITGGSGFNTYHYLRKNEYPEDFRIQILCANCNLKKEIERKKPIGLKIL